MRWAGHVAPMRNERGAWKLLVGKPEGKRPIGRPCRRCENNINHDLRTVINVKFNFSEFVRICKLVTWYLYFLNVFL